MTDLLCEQFGQLVSQGATLVHYGSNGLVCFMYFYQTFYGKCRGVQFDVLPSALMCDQCFTVVYCFPDLSLKRCSWVCGRGLEVACLQKVMYFGFILLNVQDDYSVAFVRACYHCIAILELGLNCLYCPGFPMCIMSGVWVTVLS